MTDLPIKDWVTAAAVKYTKLRFMAEDEFDDWTKCLEEAFFELTEGDEDE